MSSQTPDLVVLSIGPEDLDDRIDGQLLVELRSRGLEQAVLERACRYMHDHIDGSDWFGDSIYAAAYAVAKEERLID